jgi:hypothetical protein
MIGRLDQRVARVRRDIALFIAPRARSAREARLLSAGAGSTALATLLRASPEPGARWRRRGVSLAGRRRAPARAARGAPDERSTRLSASRLRARRGSRRLAARASTPGGARAHESRRRSTEDDPHRRRPLRRRILSAMTRNGQSTRLGASAKLPPVTQASLARARGMWLTGDAPRGVAADAAASPTPHEIAPIERLPRTHQQGKRSHMNARCHRARETRQVPVR